MERLIVQNFGPIRDVDIEIPRLLVFIGDQATGKSTLGKLIYIFKRASNMISRSSIFRPQPPVNEEEVQRSVLSGIKSHFDVCFFYDNTKIEYIYSDGYAISISLNVNNGIYVKVSEKLRITLGDLNKLYINYSALKTSRHGSDTKVLPTPEEMETVHAMFKGIRELGEKVGRFSIFEYMRASRAEYAAPVFGVYTSSMDSSVTRLALSDFAELLYSSKNIDGAVQSFFETIMEGMPPKEFFEKRGKLADYDKIYAKRRKFALLQSKIYARLVKLAYKLTGGYLGEKEEQGYGMTLSNNLSVFVPYIFLSSGQQSIIPLIAGIALIGSIPNEPLPENLPFNSAVLEEPEAHVYPKNQFNLVKLVAAALAINRWSQFVITTHSPYILASIHALSSYGLADGEVDELGKYDDLVPLKSDRKSLGIYLLKDGHAKSLRDEGSGLFDTSEIDSISEEINEVFDESVIAREMKKGGE